MSWKATEKPKTTRVTRQLAEEFAMMKPAPNDRRMKPHILSSIRKAIDSQTLRTVCWASAYCAETNETYRVNGKHTSTTMHQMNGEMPKDLYASVERYECDTLADVASLYSTFDKRGSARSTGDINRAFSASDESLSEIPHRIIDLCVTGIALSFWEQNYTSRDPEERAQLMIGNRDFVLWANDIVDQNKDKHLRRSAVFAAMFRTWKKDPKKATEFWSEVRDGSGAKPTCPTRKLERLLLTCVIHKGFKDTERKRATTREVYVKCLHAWNAWRTNSTTDLKYFQNADTPDGK